MYIWLQRHEVDESLRDIYDLVQDAGKALQECFEPQQHTNGTHTDQEEAAPGILPPVSFAYTLNIREIILRFVRIPDGFLYCQLLIFRSRCRHHRSRCKRRSRPSPCRLSLRLGPYQLSIRLGPCRLSSLCYHPSPWSQRSQTTTRFSLSRLKMIFFMVYLTMHKNYHSTSEIA